MARRRRCPPAIEAQMWMGSPVMRRLTAGCLGRLVLTVGCEMARHGLCENEPTPGIGATRFPCRVNCKRVSESLVKGRRRR